MKKKMNEKVLWSYLAFFVKLLQPLSTIFWGILDCYFPFINKNCPQILMKPHCMYLFNTHISYH